MTSLAILCLPGLPPPWRRQRNVGVSGPNTEPIRKKMWHAHFAPTKAIVTGGFRAEIELGRRAGLSCGFSLACRTNICEPDQAD
jgi:hypothetical protein